MASFRASSSSWTPAVAMLLPLALHAPGLSASSTLLFDGEAILLVEINSIQLSLKSQKSGFFFVAFPLFVKIRKFVS
jgi:hypothetical protein